jgi:hypothetical protein
VIKEIEYFSFLQRKKMSLFVSFLLLIFFYPGIPDSRANVRPESLFLSAVPHDLFNGTGAFTRNFYPKQDVPGKSLPVHPARKANSGQDHDKCFFKETFRLPADRGQEHATLNFPGLFLGYYHHSNSYIYCLPFVLISSKTGNNSRIRPPPDI